MANFNYNKVILGGRLTAEPELKQTPSGVAVATFGLAVNRKGSRDTTDFFNVVAWRNNAEFISKYFKKGSCICITGSLQVRSFNDRDGNKRSVIEVVADEASFVDSVSEAPKAAVQNRRDVEAPSPTVPEVPKFEELSDDEDLPF